MITTLSVTSQSTGDVITTYKHPTDEAVIRAILELPLNMHVRALFSQDNRGRAASFDLYIRHIDELSISTSYLSAREMELVNKICAALVVKGTTP